MGIIIGFFIKKINIISLQSELDKAKRRLNKYQKKFDNEAIKTHKILRNIEKEFENLQNQMTYYTETLGSAGIKDEIEYFHDSDAKSETGIILDENKDSITK